MSQQYDLRGGVNPPAVAPGYGVHCHEDNVILAWQGGRICLSQDSKFMCNWRGAAAARADAADGVIMSPSPCLLLECASS